MRRCWECFFTFFILLFCSGIQADHKSKEEKKSANLVRVPALTVKQRCEQYDKALGDSIPVGFLPPIDFDLPETDKNASKKDKVHHPGHSNLGSAFNRGPRQAAKDLAGGTGEVSFPVSTKNKLAQAYFDQAIGQLHGFQYVEAERSFRKVLSLEPKLAMAYWGLAMTTRSPRSEQFFKKAKKLADPKTSSLRERAYIEALSSKFATKKIETPDGKKIEIEAPKDTEYIDKMYQISRKYPKDVEAKAFLTLAMYQSFGGDYKKLQKKYAKAPHNWDEDYLEQNEKFFQQIFAKNPKHPVHHYRIHMWDGPVTANRALSSAENNGWSGPGIAHMWHMPGHIYDALRMRRKAAYHQEASARKDNQYISKNWIMPYQVPFYFHNNEWASTSFRQVGQVRKAIEIAKNLMDIPTHPNYLQGEYGGQRRLIEALAQYEMWEEAIELSKTKYLHTGLNLVAEMARLRLLGLAYLNTGKQKEFREIEQLLECFEKSAKKSEKARAEREKAFERKMKEKFKAIGPKDKDKGGVIVIGPGGGAMMKSDQQEDPFGVKATQLELAIAKKLREKKSAAKELAELKKIYNPQQGPTEAELGIYYLKQGDKKKALYWGEKSQSDDRKKKLYEAPSMIRHLEILHKTGERKKALEQAKELANKTELGTIDKALPFVRRVAELSPAYQEFADPKKHAPALWKVDAQHPRLSHFGPLLWKRQAAKNISFQTADGGDPKKKLKALNLEKFKGRPVVLVFNLGIGCLHCNDQLSALLEQERNGKKGEKFRDLGMEVVVVSTDDAKGLKKQLGQIRGEKNLTVPFRMGIDASKNLDAFKKFGVYDDFEDQPLHGMFLIDPQGRIAWQDISYEPFMDMAFLRREFTRLLER